MSYPSMSISEMVDRTSYQSFEENPDTTATEEKPGDLEEDENEDEDKKTGTAA